MYIYIYIYMYIYIYIKQTNFNLFLAQIITRFLKAQNKVSESLLLYFMVFVVKICLVQLKGSSKQFLLHLRRDNHM